MGSKMIREQGLFLYLDTPFTGVGTKPTPYALIPLDKTTKTPTFSATVFTSDTVDGHKDLELLSVDIKSDLMAFSSASVEQGNH